MRGSAVTQEIYFATGNQAKFDEAQKFLAAHAPHIVLKQFVCDLPELQTLDQKTVACEKARHAYNMLKNPVLIDDSGLYFTNYNNFPGTLSKYVYEGIGYEGIFKLVNPGDPAAFVLTLVCWYGPEQYEVFESRCEGKMVAPRFLPSTPKSFPFMSIFSPLDSDLSFAELYETPAWANYSWRYQALGKFIAWSERYTGDKD